MSKTSEAKAAARGRRKIRASRRERKYIEELAKIAGCAPWSGRTGTTDRTVFFELLRLGHRLSRRTPFCSIRSLALHADVSDNTALHAVHRLRKAGWISTGRFYFDPRDYKEKPRATAFCLRKPPKQVRGKAKGAVREDRALQGLSLLFRNRAPVKNIYSKELRDFSCEDWGAACDTAHIAPLSHRNGLWRNVTGLGHSAERVYHGLLANAEPTRLLAKRIQINRRTVERALRKLESAGLAEKTNAGWKAAGQANDAEVPKKAESARWKQGRRSADRRVKYEVWRTDPEGRAKKRPWPPPPFCDDAREEIRCHAPPRRGWTSPPPEPVWYEPEYQRAA